MSVYFFSVHSSVSLHMWCSLIGQYSQPIRGDESIKSAAQAISIAGTTILSHASSNCTKDVGYIPAAIR